MVGAALLKTSPKFTLSWESGTFGHLIQMCLPTTVIDVLAMFHRCARQGDLPSHCVRWPLRPNCWCRQQHVVARLRLADGAFVQRSVGGRPTSGVVATAGPLIFTHWSDLGHISRGTERCRRPPICLHISVYKPGRWYRCGPFFQSSPDKRHSSHVCPKVLKLRFRSCCVHASKSLVRKRSPPTGI